MCTRSQLNAILSVIGASAREVLGESLRQVILYGSFARGDNDEESDIDIMVLADIPAERCMAVRLNMSGDIDRLSLENDVVISVTVKDCATFDKWRPVLPFYQNVLREGVSVNA